MTANKAIDVLLQAGTDLVPIMLEVDDAETVQRCNELIDAMAMGIVGLLTAIKGGMDGDVDAAKKVDDMRRNNDD